MGGYDTRGNSVTRGDSVQAAEQFVALLANKGFPAVGRMLTAPTTKRCKLGKKADALYQIGVQEFLGVDPSSSNFNSYVDFHREVFSNIDSKIKSAGAGDKPFSEATATAAKSSFTSLLSEYQKISHNNPRAYLDAALMVDYRYCSIENLEGCGYRGKDRNGAIAAIGARAAVKDVFGFKEEKDKDYEAKKAAFTAFASWVVANTHTDDVEINRKFLHEQIGASKIPFDANDKVQLVTSMISEDNKGIFTKIQTEQATKAATALAQQQKAELAMLYISHATPDSLRVATLQSLELGLAWLAKDGSRSNPEWQAISEVVSGHVPDEKKKVITADAISNAAKLCDTLSDSNASGDALINLTDANCTALINVLNTSNNNKEAKKLNIALRELATRGKGQTVDGGAPLSLSDAVNYGVKKLLENPDLDLATLFPAAAKSAGPPTGATVPITSITTTPNSLSLCATPSTTPQVTIAFSSSSLTGLSTNEKFSLLIDGQFYTHSSGRVLKDKDGNDINAEQMATIKLAYLVGQSREAHKDHLAKFLTTELVDKANLPWAKKLLTKFGLGDDAAFNATNRSENIKKLVAKFGEINGTGLKMSLSGINSGTVVTADALFNNVINMRSNLQYSDNGSTALQSLAIGSIYTAASTISFLRNSSISNDEKKKLEEYDKDAANYYAVFEKTKMNTKGEIKPRCIVFKKDKDGKLTSVEIEVSDEIVNAATQSGVAATSA